MSHFICLSLAPNLRCQDLTKVQSIIIFVPAAIEAFFSLVLALANSSLRGHKRWVLVCDGLSFFALAFLDFLAHLVPDISTSQRVFSVIDFIIAAASFVPLFAYLLFLLLFAKSNLTKSIPSRFNRALTILLSLIFPLVIIFNVLGSLLGTSHQTLVTAQRTPIIAVGFSNVTFQRVALFFSSATLVLLILFQAALFTLTFVRVVRAFIDERRVEDMPRPARIEQIHLFRGLGWLTAGLKLGAIESVVGFAEISFAVVLTRRLLRLFGRGAVIIGVIKGLNVVEDFVQFDTYGVRTIRSEPTGATSNRPREAFSVSQLVISNPRTSTFLQLSPNATSFHTAQIANRAWKSSSLPLLLRPNSTYNRFDSQLENHPSPPAQSRQRVTVHWDGKAAPVLDVRFSTLNFFASGLPIPLQTPLSVKEGSRKDDESLELNGAVVPDRSSLSSNSSLASGSLSEAVRELASRFPPLPSHVTTPSTMRYDRRLPSRVQSSESLYSDWKDSEAQGPDVRGSMSYPIPAKQGDLRTSQNLISRFSIATSLEDREGSYRDSINTIIPTNQSPLTTPGLSRGPTLDTVSMLLSPARFEAPPFVSPRASTKGRRFHDRPTSSQTSSFVGEWPNQASQRVERPGKARPPDINHGIEEIVHDAWRHASKIRIHSVSPAQRTPPAMMSPMRKSVCAVEDEERDGIILHSPYSF